MAEVTGTVRVHQRQILVEWDIEKFFERKDEELISEDFSFADASWYISIYPNGSPDYGETVGCVCLYLQKKYSYTNSSTKEHRVAYKMGIKKADGSVYRTFDGENIFKEIDLGYGSEEFLKNSELHESMSTVAPDNVLRVFCFARLIDDDMESATQVSPSESIIHLETLAENLKELCLGGRYSDVRIKVKDQEFQAHKSMLTARSTVFSSMFAHDTAENRSGVIDITDCDPDSFRNFLLYLYTGKVDAVTCSDACGLYMIADKYDLQQLKPYCVEIMTSKISVESFCDVTLTAAMYDESELLKTATDFFIKNMKNIFPSVEWQSFLKNHPTIANELLIKMANSN